jgi:EAL domain-containing protein (putative c-di-GMP-specific phosphodiesterase class I)
MLSERDDETIVAAVLGLADHLGLVAVAEGVESREQLERLRALGCAYGQGFLWSPAVPPAQFVAEVRSAMAAPWVPRVVAAS